jgi:hypothetical protein
MGDFNFDKKWEDALEREEKVVKKYLCEDAWETLHPNDPGYTVDNVNRSPKRIDRFVYFSHSSFTFLPKFMEILGKTGNEKNNMKISDHYGLFIKSDLSINNF